MRPSSVSLRQVDGWVPATSGQQSMMGDFDGQDAKVAYLSERQVPA
ncbi:MAG TPA: hypothetical protein VEK74_03095 [Burkholderiaceae bacterium]|nr:hypothetical protein [Burkholderiaceae bacterium]